MGAQSVWMTVRGESAKEAYEDALAASKEQNGNDRYSGTLAAKQGDGFVELAAPKGVKPADYAQKLLDGNGRDYRFQDKSGPVGMILVKSEKVVVNAPKGIAPVSTRKKGERLVWETVYTLEVWPQPDGDHARLFKSEGYKTQTDAVKDGKKLVELRYRVDVHIQKRPKTGTRIARLESKGTKSVKKTANTYLLFGTANW